jgi:hypothetical protein
MENKDQMRPKKETPHDLTREGSKMNSRKAVCKNENTKTVEPLQVSIRHRGFSVQGFKRSGKDNSDNLKNREEGDICGWSASSRRRFRRFLMDNSAPPDWDNYAVTLTVPGPVMEAKQYKDLWDNYRKRLSKKKIIVVWRCEVQKRGALHWHCIASIPKQHTVRKQLRESKALAIEWLVCDWWEAVRKLGEVVNYETEKTIIHHATSRMALFGAMEHAVDLQEEKQGDAWWRYLCDHASKAKQEQIGEDIGRHWGVFGRGYVVENLPSSTHSLDESQFFKLHRFIRRLSRPRVKDERDPFGYRLGFAPHLSLFGRVDRFGRQHAIGRLIDFVKSAALTS